MNRFWDRKHASRVHRSGPRSDRALQNHTSPPALTAWKQNRRPSCHALACSAATPTSCSNHATYARDVPKLRLVLSAPVNRSSLVWKFNDTVAADGPITHRPSPSAGRVSSLRGSLFKGARHHAISLDNPIEFAVYFPSAICRWSRPRLCRAGPTMAHTRNGHPYVTHPLAVAHIIASSSSTSRRCAPASCTNCVEYTSLRSISRRDLRQGIGCSWSTAVNQLQSAVTRRARAAARTSARLLLAIGLAIPRHPGQLCRNRSTTAPKLAQHHRRRESRRDRLRDMQIYSPLATV